MLVIFGIMSTVKCKCSSPKISVNIFYLICSLSFCQVYYRRFYQFFSEHGCLSHKSPNYIRVILSKHCRNGIVLGGEIEQSEVVILKISNLQRLNINIAVFVNVWIIFKLKILKSQRVCEI